MVRPNVKLLVITLVVITILTLAGVYAAQATDPPDAKAAKTPDGQARQADGDPDADVVATVPEPGTIVLLGLGAGAMVLKRRNRKS